MQQGEVRLPEMGESVQEATVTKWHKAVGDTIEQDEVLLEVSTDKVDTEIPAPTSGRLSEIRVVEGTVAKVGSILAIIDRLPDGVEGDIANKPQPQPQPTTKSAPETDERIRSSPLVRRMAAEHGVNLQQITGTGINGRITKHDLATVMTKQLDTQTTTTPALTAPIAPLAPRPVPKGGEERVPMSVMRRKIAEHMVLSKQTSPHVTSVIEVNMQRIVDLRAREGKEFQDRYGFKLSFTPFFMQAAINGIKSVPIINASVDGSDVIYKKDINLGMAVALESGLIVPVIHQAAEKSFVGLARSLDDVAQRARTKKLTPTDVQGGTFSITNFGVFGTLIGQPIINQPQAAIMGIGAMEKRAVVIDDAIAIRSMCYVVLSFDHRIVDGAESGRFLATVKHSLENWDAPII